MQSARRTIEDAENLLGRASFSGWAHRPEEWPRMVRRLVDALREAYPEPEQDSTDEAGESETSTGTDEAP